MLHHRSFSRSYRREKDVRKRLLAILAKHRHHLVCDDRELGFVCGGQVDEHVPSVERDFGVFRVDDGRHGQDRPVRVVDDRIDGGFFDKMQVPREMFFALSIPYQNLGPMGKIGYAHDRCQTTRPPAFPLSFQVQQT